MRSETLEIEQYLNGTMPLPEREAFEVKLSHDPFLADAVAGFETDPAALYDLPVYQFHFQWWWAGIGLATVLMVLMAFPQKEISRKPANVLSQSQTMRAAPGNAIPVQKPIKRLPNLKAEPTPSTPYQLQAKPAERVEARSEAVFAEKINPLAAALALSERKPQLKYNANLVYILDYKTVDYPDKQEGEASFDLAHLTNYTPARWAGRLERNTFAPAITKKPKRDSYAMQIEPGIRALKRKDYKTALNIFTALNVQNPQDVNALFYSGLCRFEMDQFKRASRIFTEVEKNANPAFAPEAKWYRASCLYRLGRKNEADRLLEEIIRDKGHYAVRAAMLQKKITGRATKAAP